MSDRDAQEAREVREKTYFDYLMRQHMYRKRQLEIRDRENREYALFDLSPMNREYSENGDRFWEQGLGKPSVSWKEKVSRVKPHMRIGYDVRDVDSPSLFEW